MKIVWDRTNIGENYPGITLPLTYSFIRHAYARVYMAFMRLTGVEEQIITKNKNILENMLGYLNGRVYYRIENWYTFLTFLPGYRFNRDFFESMLDPAVKKSNAPDRRIKMGVTASVGVLMRFLFLFFIPGILDRKFNRVFRKLYADFRSKNKLELSEESLIDIYERTRDTFFSVWAYTIVNDFRVMIYFGILSKLVNRYAAGEGLRYLSHLKLRPESAKPLGDLLRIATAVSDNKNCRQLFEDDAEAVLKRLRGGEFPNLYAAIKRYLTVYGDRSANELKLEEPKFRERPEMLVSLLSQYVKLGGSELKSRLRFMDTDKKLEKIQVRNLLMSVCISLLSEISIKAMYRREKYRLRRAMVFGLARGVFIELGRRLAAAGDIVLPEDVFYLYHEELIDYCRFHRLPENLKKLIEERKKNISELTKMEMPRRATSTGYPNSNNISQCATSRQSGVGTSRGRVKAEAIVVETLDYSLDYRGKILVTRATDPGWTVIFPLIKGVVTEQGGVLSHASIVAREVGIPCIVQAADITEIIKNGDIIDMDGGSGKITILT